MQVPTEDEFREGFQTFRTHEERDAMYKVATYLLEDFWGQPADMADGLGVLLLTWNQSFYRTQSFNFAELEDFLDSHFDRLNEYRERNIDSFSDSDIPDIENIFNELLNATRLQSGSREGYRSPVGVAKGLHLLAPKFFPLWDKRIAEAYGYSTLSKNNPSDYIEFCWDMKQFAYQIEDYDNPENKSVLKLIDEYNYSKYTQGWI